MIVVDIRRIGLPLQLVSYSRRQPGWKMPRTMGFMYGPRHCSTDARPPPEGIHGSILQRALSVPGAAAHLGADSSAQRLQIHDVSDRLALEQHEIASHVEVANLLEPHVPEKRGRSEWHIGGPNAARVGVWFAGPATGGAGDHAHTRDRLFRYTVEHLKSQASIRARERRWCGRRGRWRCGPWPGARATS